MRLLLLPLPLWCRATALLRRLLLLLLLLVLRLVLNAVERMHRRSRGFTTTAARRNRCSTLCERLRRRCLRGVALHEQLARGVEAHWNAADGAVEAVLPHVNELALCARHHAPHTCREIDST